MLHVASLLLAAASMVGCLPADTRPVPAHVHVAVTRDPELGDGSASFTSTDGWTVTLDTLVVSMGNVAFDGDGCNDYSEARYTHLLDLNRTGLQKLGELYGLNACTLRFGARLPQADTVLGQGLTSADRDSMQNSAVPVSSTTGPTTVQGMALHIAGQVAKDGVIVHFDWGFSDPVRFSECKRRIAGNLEANLSLASGQHVEIPITVDPRNLFQVGLDPKSATGDASTTQSDASLADPDAGVVVVGGGTLGVPPMALVQWIADADQITGNKNGHVAVDELIKVMLPGAEAGQNLAEILRLLAYPSLFRYADDGQCTVTLNQTRHGGGFF